MTIESFSDQVLLKLLTWLSPSFPVGAYAYSHGLECAVEEHLIWDAGTLQVWIDGIITHGTGRTDNIFFSETWRAVNEGDNKRLSEILALARAYQPTSELAIESTAQGAAFMDAIGAAWSSDQLTSLARFLKLDETSIPYPVAVALVTSLHRIPLRDALLTYLHSFMANLVSAGVRLIPLGQKMGLQVLAGLTDSILKSLEAGMTSSIDNIGSATLLVDWTSARHEIQYTRLFRS